MRKRTRGFLALSVCLGLSGWARAQEPPAPKPTPEHERLAEDVGTWDATVKVSSPAPGAEPTESKGVEVVKLMPGGLWQLSEFHGKVGEMAFHGSGQTGYDSKKGKYIGTWVDSMSSEIAMMEGDYDSKTKTMTMTMKGTEPTTGKPYEARLTSIHKDKDTRVFTMSMKNEQSGGEYMKMMEITYVRRPEKGTGQ
jgi:hypothetical protein